MSENEGENDWAIIIYGLIVWTIEHKCKGKENIWCKVFFSCFNSETFPWKKQNTFRLELNFRRRGGRLSEERPTETPRSWVRRRACGRCHSPVTSEDNRCQNSHVEPSRRGALYFLFGRVSWVRVPVLQRACRPCEVPSDATLLVKRMSIFAANYNCHYFDDEALFYLGRPLGWRPLGPFSSQRLTRHHSRQTKKPRSHRRTINSCLRASSRSPGFDSCPTGEDNRIAWVNFSPCLFTFFSITWAIF